MNQNSSVRKLARCGVVAAIYVVLCLALQPFSYGAVQVRVAEALCLLPVFGVEYIAGVVLGCFLANLLGSTIVDVIFGTLATLLACLVTYRLRNIRFKGLALAASLPPVLFNAVIIGIEIAVMFPDPSSSAPIWLACITNGISVGIGELISCTVLGVLLVKIIESNTALSQIFGPMSRGRMPRGGRTARAFGRRASVRLRSLSISTEDSATSARASSHASVVPASSEGSRPNWRSGIRHASFRGKAPSRGGRRSLSSARRRMSA